MKPGVFIQLYTHLVFAVKYRERLLIKEIRAEVSSQEIHHKRRTFRQEYTELLKKFEIEYDEKYLFDFFG